MFFAGYFTYDGIYSGEYGLRIAAFDDETVNTTEVYALTPVTSSPSKLKKFYYGGSKLDTPLSYEFTILSDGFIPDAPRREIIRWLLGRNTYRKLKIHQIDMEEYEFNCAFTSLDIVYARGHCVGFNVTAMFDSPYAYGKPRVMKVTGTGEKKTIKFINASDLVDGYVYPKVTFTVKQNTSDKAITILNKTDDVARPFEFGALTANEQVTVDNELRIITSSVSGDKLSSFNKNWLRLRQGVNELDVTINGEATIEAPKYVLIGF